MGQDGEHLQDDLLRRAQRAVDAAGEILAQSEVIAHVSAKLRTTGMTSRCAWCGRYRIGDRWVLVSRSALIERTRTSHGICEDCVEALRSAGLSV